MKKFKLKLSQLRFKKHLTIIRYFHFKPTKAKKSKYDEAFNARIQLIETEMNSLNRRYPK